MMWKIAVFLKHISIVIFLCFVLPKIKCTDIKCDDLEGKQLLIINDEDIYDKIKYGTLNAKCNSTNSCNNGASCYNDECICLPGTSGPSCETINGCSDLSCNKDKNASCDFDKRNFKAFCKCPWGYEFDYDENKCKECRCDDCKEGQPWCTGSVKCEFIQSKKACTCDRPRYKFNPKKKMCELCYCSGHSVSCDFDEDGNQICKCKDGYAQKGWSCDECKCYYGWGCKFVNNNKICICLKGYVQDKGDCYRCSCGENGKCVWDWSHTQIRCDCNPGFMEFDGVCKEISNCYCGENSNCTLKDNEKICSCQEGFTYMNGLCTDINECDNPNACPKNKKCKNLIGSYNCSCADGFQPSEDKEGECDDIDECQNANSCAGSETECFNTVGSFRCVCKSGFATRDGMAASPICENKSSWKTGFGLLIGIFLAIIIGLVIMIYRKT
ncbi:latent-transforming growth factor beta-binding protein 1-like isoform X3 [Parasteatoda tepidariorum]|uniref:latent-transforming growth factor beta-binding protein 1-like isoform X3 n=1 Tax=Parasteatoda tepidariorum TaxID=114398 RepID=UPI0039BD09AC